MYKKQGFTLIELLVVVLIIGILAAVALPQYQVAVGKSRVAQLLPFMNSVRSAQEAYYLANGAYSDDWSELDVSIPSGVTISACSSGGRNTQCAKVIEGISCSLQSSGGVLYCSGNKIPEIGYAYEHGSVYNGTGKRVCYASENNEALNKICKSLGGVFKKTEHSQHRYEF